MMENVFDYEDIQLIPAKCIVNSRSECDTTVTLGKHKFKLPVVPANMQTIIDERIATYLAENNYFISCIVSNQRNESHSLEICNHVD